MLELQIVYNLLNKEQYQKYRGYIKPSEEFEQYYKVLDKLSSLNRDITLEEYTAALPEKLEFSISSSFGEDYIEKALSEIKLRQWAYDHAALAIDVSEGRKDVSVLSSHLDTVSNTEIEQTNIVSSSLSDLVDRKRNNPSLKWRLKSLNDATGGLEIGNFTFLFARVETGKTTFLVSEVTHFASQVKSPIIWVNNEEAGHKVMERLYCSALGWTKQQLYHDVKATEAQYKKVTGDNIILLDSAQTTYWDVQNLCKKISPSLLVIDQLDKVKGFKNDRRDVQLGMNYIWAREMAKQYCPVIAVSQASDSGSNKMWLTESDVAESKTSKAAEADLIIGIGKTDQSSALRGLHILKNKLEGGHPKITCRIKPDVARYEDL